MLYAPVPVDSDADNDEDAGVGVDVIRSLYEGAQQPGHLVDRGVQLQRQREQQQDVCERQADHVHGGFGLLSPKAAEHRQGQGVENQPEDEAGDGDPQLHGPCQAVDVCKTAVLTAVSHFSPEMTKRAGWKCMRLTVNAVIKPGQDTFKHSSRILWF